MEVFGSFEAIDVAREGNFGAVYYARRAGTSEKRFAVKVFRPPELLMDDDQIDREAASFIEAAQAQQRAHGSCPSGWSPVHEFGRCPGGAWYATDLMECSLEILRITQRDLEPDHIRKIIEPLVQGLVSLRQTQGRAHGNIKPTNVLVQGRADLSKARVVLSDPKPTSRCRSPEDDQRDARDLGDLVHQLILHRPFQNLTEWPIQSTDRWQRLGRVGAAWLELVNRLIDPTTTSKPSIDEIASSLPGGPVKAAPAAKDAGRAEADRKAREDQAREDEARRKAKEAEIAQRVRAEAEKKAKEDAERKAQAQRQAEEAARAEREAAARKAEEERLRKEQQAREEAASAERARLEREAAQRREQEEKARQEKERAEKARREQEQARQREIERAEREARQAAEAEKTARAASERAASSEQQSVAAAAAAPSARPIEPSRSPPTPAPPLVVPAAEPSHAPSAPGTGGGAKKAMLAAAVVVVGGGIAAAVFLRGGSNDHTPPITGTGSDRGSMTRVDPVPDPVAADGSTGTAGAGKTDSSPSGTPTEPSVVSVAEVEQAVRRGLAAAERRITADLEQAARDRAIEHERSVAEQVRRAATEAGLGSVSSADVAAPESAVVSAAGEAAAQAARVSWSAGFSPAAPSPRNRPELGRVRDDLVGVVRSELPGASAETVASAGEAAIQGVIDREWRRIADEALRREGDRVAQAAASEVLGAVRQAFASRVEESRRIASARTQEPETAPEPPPPGPTQQDLDALIAAAASINRDLDSGSGADDGGQRARAALAELERSPWFDRVAQDGSVVRVRSRIETIGRITSASGAPLVPEARAAMTAAGGASEAIAAWTRLSSGGGEVDLNTIAALRAETIQWAANQADPALRQRIERAANDVSRERWSVSALAAQDDASIDAVKALRERMGVADGDVPQGVAFNFALRDFKQAVATSQGPINQRLEELKGPAGIFVERMEGLGGLAGDQAVDSSLAVARAILDWQDPGPAPSGGAGDLSRVGPGSVGWVAAPSADGASVTYTWPGEGASRPEQRMTFRRVDSPAGRAVYLSETEVPIGLFRRVFGPDFVANQREYATPSNGLRAWKIDGGTVVLESEIIDHPTITLRNSRAQTNQNIQRWSGLSSLETITPAWSWPLQHVSPRAAVVIAGKIGCRLPTMEEWRAAARLSGGQDANLRDESWFGVLDTARNYDFRGNPVYPDHGSIRRQGLSADGRGGRNDGFPFFAPVESGADGTWKNLLGNVAEWVLSDPVTGSDPIADSFEKVDRAWRFAVVGGSAVGPPSIAGIDAEPIADHRNGSYFDVGFRVAFTAPSGGGTAPVFDVSRLTAIEGVSYLPPGR